MSDPVRPWWSITYTMDARTWDALARQDASLRQERDTSRARAEAAEAKVRELQLRMDRMERDHAEAVGELLELVEHEHGPGWQRYADEMAEVVISKEMVPSISGLLGAMGMNLYRIPDCAGVETYCIGVTRA